MAKKNVTGEDGKQYVMKEKKPIYKKWWFWLIVVIVIGGIGSQLGGSDDKKAADSDSKIEKQSATKTKSTISKKETSKTETGSKATYSDRTLTAPDGVLKITSIESGTDYDGKPMFYVLFDLTNNTDEAKNIQILYMNFVDASQNNGTTTEKLDFAITTESPYQEQLDMLSKDLNPGQTASAAYAYEVPDESKPVTLEFKDSMFSSKPIATEDITIK